jgi:hypothetical protein
MTMQGKLIYIGNPSTAAPEPVIQVTNGGKAVITSIRIANPTSSNGSYEIHHLTRGETAATTVNAIAFNVAMNSKTVQEFLVHPLPLSPGEALWVSGDDVVFAVYGVTYP